MINTERYVVSYGSISLTATNPVQEFVEPISVGEAIAFLKLPTRDPQDDDENDLLGMFIVAAREQAEILQNRDLVHKQLDLSFDYWPYYWPSLQIPLRTPLVSVDLVQRKDADGVVTPLVLNTDYVVDTAKQPGVIVPPSSVGDWPCFDPWPSSAILIRITSGYASDDAFWGGPGARIKVGMKMLIASWYSNRLPFERGLDAASEYPFAVTSCLTYGAHQRVL